MVDSWDSAPVDSWADFDVSQISLPGGELFALRLQFFVSSLFSYLVDAAVAAAAVPAEISVPTAAASGSADPGKLTKSLPPVTARLGKDVVLGEPKKKAEKKTKREMKGEQRAAHMEKLQADSLLGRYVQSHVITLDKKQVKMSTKVAKAKEVAAVNERAKQEDNWKNWLQSNDMSETAKAQLFISDHEFQEDLEFKILLDVCDRARSLETAMPLVAELVYEERS